MSFWNYIEEVIDKQEVDSTTYKKNKKHFIPNEQRHLFPDYERTKKSA